jgi:hypothetical protein
MPAADAGCQWECSMVNELPRRRWQGRVGELRSCGERACGGAGTADWGGGMAKQGGRRYCYCGTAAGIETNGRGGEDGKRSRGVSGGDGSVRREKKAVSPLWGRYTNGVT